MATTAAPDLPQTERVAPDLKPQQLSFPLPRALHTTGHVHLTFLDHCIMAFLTTSTPGDSAGTVKPLGSFVYAMPDVSFDFVGGLASSFYCAFTRSFHPAWYTHFV